jgi:6-pyruvoyltetrahydropterin/6-carboxytetrahydropterin synthase
LTPDSLDAAVAAFNRRAYYACHEILERPWKRAIPAKKPFYQGLIQVACAYLKLERGKRGPAIRLFRRALPKLAPCRDSGPLVGFIRAVSEALAALEHGEDCFAVFERAPSLPPALASLEEAIWRLYNASGGTHMLITRRFRFSAAHRYYDESLSPEENQRLFGKCAGAHGHGHNYVLDVAVRGPIDPKTGMIVNLKDLKAAVNELVIERYDFKHLNFDVDDFQGTQPTCEQIVVTVWNLLQGRIPGCELARVRLYESDELFAEYEGR